MNWRDINKKLAIWSVYNVGTMGCAYLFAIIALVALPQAIHDSFTEGIHPLPLVNWLSQSFLQLVLLSIILCGQDLQAKITEKRDTEQFDDIKELLDDMRNGHQERHQMLMDQVTEVHGIDTIIHHLEYQNSLLICMVKKLGIDINEAKKGPDKSTEVMPI